MTVQTDFLERCKALNLHDGKLSDWLDEIESLRQQLADRDEQISDLTISSDTYFAERNSARDVWRRASKDRDELRQQLAEAQADAIEQARIVGMGGEREIELRQKLDIVSSLLREAAGRMSYGHWSTEFRARVERSLKTKVKGY